MFKNVTVVKKANIYFDGQVSSRTIMFSDGTRKTLGIMLPGEYEFGTDEAEIMEIQAGSLELLLPESSEWKPISSDQSFDVPAHAKFKVRVLTPTDYCCSYIAHK